MVKDIKLSSSLSVDPRYSDDMYMVIGDMFYFFVYEGVPGETGWDDIADYVLGQGDDFTARTINKGGLSAYSIYAPYSI